MRSLLCAVLVAGLSLAVACDGDGYNGGNGMPAAGGFDDIPLPEDATETASGSWSGGTPVTVPGADIDASAYSVRYATYQVAGSADEVFDVFKDGMDGWEELGSLSGGAAGATGGYGAWTKDDQRVVAWVVVAESEGVTTLAVYRGERNN